MELTNRFGLPDAIVQAIKNDDYERIVVPNRISATQLIDAPQIVQLKKRHWENIVIDASEMIWLTFGKAMHALLHRSNVGDIAEMRLDKEIDGFTLTGQFDLLTKEKNRLVDYKVTSVYSLKNDERLAHWKSQLEIYAWLANQHGLRVDDASIIMILRDWSMRHKYDSDLPDVPIYEVVFELNDMTTIENNIRQRIAMHKLAQTLADHELPICTSEEQWRSEDQWCIMKEGRKSSIRNLPTEEAAIKYGKDKGLYVEVSNDSAENGWIKKHYLVKREGGAKRCADYCEVKPFCVQYKREHPNAQDGDK